ncbi:PQQ-binding-like beta-propeller repeat protein [Natronorubrum texcoconense]|uniref:Outer membrane protein assembly factor BamB, contains PQQ-like beta-propeller repeat n=1 Tax=Natronorubrum texcoconense TaxID=1095776 RepID=A0A1G8SV60_9EURY|nr:PQQ-binding-like beta-propeller repeat protein [Natronorubrum texcoconense]SDJ33129.1 Outer membrane protein assembly factor BamB, contains PQQ-like beta-propeller repeat [Natronorubrum texcoconense]
MEEWHRRSVLATGAALSAGGLASITAGASEADDRVDDLPNPDLDPNPGADEDWASYRGGAGHARFVRDGHEFDGESLEAAWSVNHDSTVAVADDIVYTTTADGVVALDAADGALVWENTDIDARDPVVAGERVYLGGDEIVALDRDDGNVRWESDFDPEEWTSSHTVAYDGVFVVADGTLYALETDDGSVQWRKESAVVESTDGDERESEFVTGAAAANGVVYAGTETGTFAFDPTTGETVWRDETWYSGITDQSIYATETGVLSERSGPELALYDAQTGEMMNLPTVRSGPTLSNESVIGGNDQGYGSHSIHGDEYDWTIDVTYTYGQAVISSETIYVYFQVDGHNYGDREYDQTLVALDKRDGSEKWTISKDDAPIGHIRAISGETIYVDNDGELVALRERVDDEDAADEGDENGDDERKDEDSDDSGDGDAGESDDANGDEEASDDADGDAGEEDDGDADDGDSDCPNTESDSECEDDSSDDFTGSDDGSLGDDGGDDGDTDTGDQTENGTTDAEDNGDTDGVPGFTTGAGLVGGALGLEWLRRRGDADDPTE